MYKVLSLKDNISLLSMFKDFIIDAKIDNLNKDFYIDCLNNSLDQTKPFPQWYLIINDQEIIGCASLLVNDLNSRMDIFPWLSTLYIQDENQKQSSAKFLIEYIIKDAKAIGFDFLYVASSNDEYFENLGFKDYGECYRYDGKRLKMFSMKL